MDTTKALADQIAPRTLLCKIAGSDRRLVLLHSHVE